MCSPASERGCAKSARAGQDRRPEPRARVGRASRRRAWHPATTPAAGHELKAGARRPRPHRGRLVRHRAFVAFSRLVAAATSDRPLVHALYRTIRTSPWLSVPVGLLAVATGVLMGMGTRYGLVRHWQGSRQDHHRRRRDQGRRAAHRAGRRARSRQRPLIRRPERRHHRPRRCRRPSPPSVGKPRGRTPWARSASCPTAEPRGALISQERGKTTWLRRIVRDAGGRSATGRKPR